MGRLDGRVAVITGGARGVGRGEAIALAAEGASVVVNDLGGEWDGTGADQRPAQIVADEIIAAGGSAVANFDDVADWDGARHMIDQAIDEYGRLDILICNAGILRDRTVFNISADEWDAVIRVHLRGHIAPTKWATTYWREKAKETAGPVNGRILFTASESGLYGNGGQGNYAAAKAGIASLGITASREMERYGVTVNTISPRARTRLTENTFGDFGDGDGFDVWDPDNVAPWIVYLCCDEAAHITGQNFVVGGGLVQLMQPWTVANEIMQNERWSVDHLITASAELFGDRRAGPPPGPVLPS